MHLSIRLKAVMVAGSLLPALVWLTATVEATQGHLVLNEEDRTESDRPLQQAPFIEVTPPFGAVADEPLPDGGPRFSQPIHAPGSIPFREGLAAWERRAYGEARQAFQRVIEKYPKSALAAAAEAFLAELLIADGASPQSRADAIGRYRHLAITHPESDNTPRAYWRIGDLYAGMGLYPEAHGAYSRWLADGKPGWDLDRARLGSGVNKLLWGKGAEAAADFEALRRQTKDEALLRYATIGLADAWALEQKHAEAKDLYETVFRAWPDDVKRHPRSIQSFASTCAASGLVKQARWLYEQFYNLNPMHPRSGAMLILAGDTYLQQGRPDRAALFYQHVLAQHANTEASDRAYLRLAQLGGASIRQDPERSLSAQVRGLMDVTSGLIMDESSQETIYRAVAIDRADTALGSEAQYLLGQHHERAGNLTDAVAVYRSLRERRGVVDGDAWPSAAAQRLRAILSPWVAAALARRDDLTAIKLYRSAGEDPEHIYDDVALLVGVADAYQRLGLSGEAVKLFQVALRAPDHERVLSPALLGLGRAYMDQADIPAARQVFQRFRLQFPLAPERGEALTALIALAERDQDRKTVIRLSKIWLRDFPNEPARASVMLSLAEALVRDGGIDDALRVYAQAEQVRPTVSAGNWLHHADVLISGGRPAEAVRRYQLALLSRPTAEEDAWARVRMASALRQLNRRANAAAVLAPIRGKKADELVGRYANMLERDLDLGGGG